MTTTIQLSDETKHLLDVLKEEENAPSYDKVVLTMAKQRLKIPESMFGALPKIRWKKEYRMDFHEHHLRH